MIIKSEETTNNKIDKNLEKKKNLFKLVDEEVLNLKNNNYSGSELEAKIFELNDNEKKKFYKYFSEKILDISNEMFNGFVSNDDDFNLNERNNFFKNLKYRYFSSDPNFLSFLDLSDRVLFLSKIKGNYFLDLFFSSEISSSLTYSLNFLDDKEVEKLSNNISTFSLEDRLWIIKSLNSIGLSSTDDYSSKTRKRIIEIMEKIEKSSQEVLIKFILSRYKGMLEEVYSVLDDNLEDPKKTAWIHNNSWTRDIESFIKDNRISDEEIIFPDGIIFENNILELFKISKDYRGVFNKNLTSIALNYLDQKNTNEFVSYNSLPLITKKYNEKIIQFIHNPEVIKFFESSFNIKLTDIKLKDQIYFTQFLAESNEDNFDRIRNIFKNKNLESLYFLKAFLAIYPGGDFGENILSIAENKKPEITNKIFEKYAEIVDSVDEIEDFLMEEFSQESENNPELVKEISNDLLKKGKDFLKNISEDDSGDEIIETLKNLKVETELFKTVFRKLSECREEGCSLEEAKSLSLDKIEGIDILANPEIASEMKKIYLDNYPDEEDFSEEFRNGLLESFEKKITNENTDFYLVKKDDEIIGFDSFTKKDNYIEFANFNLNKDFKGAKIGGALLDETLFKIGESSIVRAVALKDSDILRHYIDDLGFKIIDDSGKKFKNKEIVEIELDIRKSKD